MTLRPPIESLLAGLSRATPLDFELKDADGTVILSTVPPPTGAAGVSGHRTGRPACCSLPIRGPGGADAGTLSASGLVPARGPDGGMAAGDIRRELLQPLAELIEENLAKSRESEKMAEALTRSFEEIHLYSHIAKQVKTLHFSCAMLEDLLGDLKMAMRTDMAFAYLPRRPEYQAVVADEACVRRTGPAERFIEKLIRGLPEPGAVSKAGHFVVNDSAQSASYGPLHTERFRFLVVPVAHNDAIYGFLGMFSFNMGEIFRRGEMRMLMSMAEQVGLVISNTDLFRNLEDFLVSMVKSLVHAIEAKDAYTRGHSERVHRYCRMMADSLQMAPAEKRILEWAALLHDVGKIGIPESILNKPGRLTDEEYAVIKEHPGKGYNILKPIAQLTDALPGILHHHERYDGGGYPEGLAGESIPLNGRIIAVADTFDAIASNRAYRAGKSKAEALAIVRDVAGTQLDPHLAERFAAILEKNDNPFTEAA